MIEAGNNNQNTNSLESQMGLPVFEHPLFRSVSSEQGVYLPPTVPLAFSASELEQFRLFNPEGSAAKAPKINNKASNG